MDRKFAALFCLSLFACSDNTETKSSLANPAGDRRIELATRYRGASAGNLTRGDLIVSANGSEHRIEFFRGVGGRNPKLMWINDQTAIIEYCDPDSLKFEAPSIGYGDQKIDILMITSANTITHKKVFCST